jgi:uncharacterized protein DUF6897
MVVRNFLEGRIGKEMDIHVGGAIISGRIVRIEGNVLIVEKDDTICYINIDRIIALWDSKEKKGSLPGFVQRA